MKRIFKLLAFAAFSIAGILEMSAQKPVLRYNENGKFKIVQFTDTHIIFDNVCLKTDIRPCVIINEKSKVTMEIRNKNSFNIWNCFDIIFYIILNKM